MANKQAVFPSEKLEISALEDTKDSYKFINYNYLAKKFNIQDEIDLYHYYYNHKEDKKYDFHKYGKITNGYICKTIPLIVTTGGPNCTNYFLTKRYKRTFNRMARPAIVFMQRLYKIKTSTL